MKKTFSTTALSKMGPQLWRVLLGILVVTFALSTGASAQDRPKVNTDARPAINKKSTSTSPPAGAWTGAISAAQFSRMVQDFSEEEGSFPSDNYVSNEATYLHVTDKLKQLRGPGGAYVGVGPEQNFTYIATTRPDIAFIVDIRRQAIIQHLMYKAIFHLASNRAQFLALLFSKPLKGKDAPGADAPIEALTEYFSQAPTSDEAFAENLAMIRKTIATDFEFPLSPKDQEMLEHVYSAFQQANLGITTRWFGRANGAGWYGGFPTLKDLLVEKDVHGNQGNFLAGREDYDFLRELNRKNRIIPVVGDFAGSKALTTVADYLRRNGYTVMAYYTSNVEQYLFGDQVFGEFAENVRKLPINDKSVFIRSIRGGQMGRRTVLQKITGFLQDFDKGLYQDYRNLSQADFFADDDPPGSEQ